jgi:hypothetical protein
MGTPGQQREGAPARIRTPPLSFTTPPLNNLLPWQLRCCQFPSAACFKAFGRRHPSKYSSCRHRAVVVGCSIISAVVSCSVRRPPLLRRCRPSVLAGRPSRHRIPQARAVQISIATHPPQFRTAPLMCGAGTSPTLRPAPLNMCDGPRPTCPLMCFSRFTRLVAIGAKGGECQVAARVPGELFITRQEDQYIINLLPIIGHVLYPAGEVGGWSVRLPQIQIRPRVLPRVA